MFQLLVVLELHLALNLLLVAMEDLVLFLIQVLHGL
jgi:hypothetical protein